MKNFDFKNYLLVHPRMATISPAEQAILPNFTRHYVKEGIGVVPIKGYLCSGLIDWLGTTYAQVEAVLKKLEDDPEVRGVLLSVDSCGGDAAGCFEFAEMIRNFSKPIETYIEAEASSAAYLISAATSFITMHKSAFAGSIGAVVSAYKDPKIETKTIASAQSPFKNVDLFDVDGEQRIQSHLNQIAGLFINDVAQYRKTDSNNILSNYGQGDVLFSAQALQVGMVDSVGNLQTALAHLQNTINLNGADNQNNNIQNDNKKLSKKLSSNTKRNRNRDKKINRGKKNMNRRIKTAFVFIDDSEIPEGATTVTDVSIETLDENFPEIMEGVRQTVRDEIAAENQAVDDASEAADMADPEEAEAVAMARRKEISPMELTNKLLKIKSEKLKDPKLKAQNELQDRAQDNPKVAASVGANGSDLLDQEPTRRNGKATASRLGELRNKKRRAK
jgi:ClpP class serine protease